MPLQKIICVCILSILSVISYAQTNFNTKLDTYLNVLNVNKKFNGEVLIAKDSTIIYQKAIGLSSYEHNIPMQVGNKYKIASISKSFTSTMIAIAQEEGRLNFDDLAETYAPNLSEKFKNITIKQLLNHTSGLPHNEGIENYWQEKSKLQMNKNQIIEEINTLQLLFQPGSKMKYSSIGYYVLTHILENIYQQDYHALLENKLLTKLQMENTGAVNTLKIIPKMTSGYHLVNDDSLLVAPYRNYSILKGAGGLYSSTTDLLHFNNSFFMNKLLPQRTKEILFSPQQENQKSEFYAMGWYTDISNNKLYHGGGTWGYSCSNAIYVDKEISIIVLSNVSTLPITTIASNIEKIVFDQPFTIPEIRASISTNNINLDKYTGTYRSESSNMMLAISKEDNHLYLKLGKNPKFKIYAENEFNFFGKKVAININFKNEQNLITGLTAKRGAQSFRFKKRSK